MSAEDKFIQAICNGNPTRTITFKRDSQNRITEIYDPNSLSNNPASIYPLIRYNYDPTSGNLVVVDKLVDRNKGTFESTFYQYTNTTFPHFLTGIINADGTQVARTFYDDSGRIIAVEDADGKKTQFIHSLTNKTEVIIDRLGYTNSCVYDLRGNVTATTNAVGGVTTMAYDNNNNKTNSIVYLLNGQSYATNSCVYDANSLMLASTDPLGYTNGFTYDSYGNVKTSADAKGNPTFNTYDGGNNLISATDALGHGITNSYINGLLVGSIDAIGTVTANYYDGNGNLTGTATFAAGGVTILSTNSFTYDGNGNRLTSTVWRQVGSSWTNATTTYIYDAMNRVVQTIDPDGGTNTVVYNSIGKQQATIDKLSRTTTCEYSERGQLVRTTYPDLTAEISAYDANGNRTNSVNRLGRTTTYIYDALNRLTQTIYPDNTTSTTVYDDVGRVAKTVDAIGNVTAFAYDAAGRRLAVTNAWGVSIQTVSSYDYDANGNQIYFTNALGMVTTNVFDALNRQVQTLFPDGTKISTVYDVAGRRIAGVDQANITNWFGYDGAGRLTSVTNTLNQVTHYQYDETGSEIAQIDALNRTNTFAYDGMGRRIKHAMPGGQAEGFSYDLAGNLIYATNFNGVIITNQYDVMNRLTNRASVNGYKVSYTYTATGQRQTMTDPSGSTSYAYDNRDRLVLKTVNWSGGGASPPDLSVSLNYRYDANGNLTNLWSSTANGVTNVYQYDALNRLTNVVGQASSLSQYSYDLAGNLQSMRYANGVTNQYQYDKLNRLTNSVWKLNTGTLASFSYQLGLTGNRTSLLETNNGANRNYTWNYDQLYRLTNETIGGTSYTSPQTLGYSYDSVGNRTIRTNITGSLNLTNQSFTFSTNDWLTTDQYDANGNTTNASGNTYQYDALNHVTNVNNGAILITYDGDGNRVGKKVGSTTTYYLVDDRNPSGYAQVLEEYQSLNSQPATLNRIYNYGLSLVSQKQGSTTYYFIYDGHGSTRMLTDAGGNFVNAFAYDAYGNLIASNSTPQTVYLYCCQQWDPDLGFYHLRAREDNPNTGRFLSSDSFAGNNEDPLSLHKYLYCQGNPVDGTDPSGEAVYFVKRKLGKWYGREAWPIGVGHGYLYFTDPSDPGTGDPFTTHQTPVDSFSWHPNTWKYQGSRAPGRIWENDYKDDWNPPSQHRAFCATTDPGAETTLLNYIKTWKQETGCGYELGNPKSDPNVPHNDIGSDDHKPAPPGGVYYSVTEQNCVWWATIMLKQSNIQVNPAVYNAIVHYNWGFGAASQVINGTRSAYDVRTISGVPFKISSYGVDSCDLSGFDTGL